MTRKATKILISAAVPLFIGIVAVVWFLLVIPHRAAASIPKDQVEIVEVEKLSKVEGIEISGNIEPTNSADLAFPIAGYIDAVYVQVGDLVATGETVAVLKDSQYRYDLASVDVEIDKENVTGTQRNLELLKLKREMTVSALEDTRLKSTISGIVTSVEGEKGDYVRAQQAGSETDVVVRVIDRSTMTAAVEVDELDAPYLKAGQKVAFQFDAYPDLEIFGEVSFVPLEARETTQGIAVLDAEVAISNPPSEILPYFTFSGEIFLDDSEEILLLPEQAVTTRGDRTMVMRLMLLEETAGTGKPQRSSPSEGGAAGGPAALMADLVLPEGYTVVPTQVSVTKYGSGKVQVLSGLAAGERVIIPTSTGVVASAASDKEESKSFLDLLGMPSGGGPGGGGPPPGGRP